MIGAALEDLDLSAVLAALREAEDKYGHTAASDAKQSLEHFRDELRRRAGEAGDVILPGDRQNLDVGYRRAARLGALCLSTMRRIRAEQSGAPTDA